MEAKFKAGDKVKHAKSATNQFPEGTGTVTEVLQANAATGFTYRVQCDSSGKVLPATFTESELQPNGDVNAGTNASMSQSHKAAPNTID